MRTALLAPSLAVLFVLISACCFMGTQRPGPDGGGSGAAAAPIPAPTAGHTCHLEVTVVFPATKLDGSPWDVGGGRPDPFLVFHQDGARVGQTARVQDSTSAHWAVDVACEHAHPLVIEAIDGDVSLDDSADTIDLPGRDPGAPAGAVHVDTWGTGGVHFDVTVDYR